jgi:hypothetical protein
MTKRHTDVLIIQVLKADRYGIVPSS